MGSYNMQEKKKKEKRKKEKEVVQQDTQSKKNNVNIKVKRTELNGVSTLVLRL
jgi:hypothetical protein